MSLFFAVFSLLVASTVSSTVELARFCSGTVCEFTYDGPNVYTFSFDVPVVRIQLPDRFEGAYLNITVLSTIETVEYHGTGNISCGRIIGQQTITLVTGKSSKTCTYGTTTAPSEGQTKTLQTTTSLSIATRLQTVERQSSATHPSLTRLSSTGQSSTHHSSTSPSLTRLSSTGPSLTHHSSTGPSLTQLSSTSPSSTHHSSTHLSSQSHSLDEFTVSTISLSIIVGGCLILIVVFLILHFCKILKIKHIRFGNLSLEMSSVGLTRPQSEPNISSITTTTTPDRHRSLPNLSTSTPTISTISPASPPPPVPPHRYPTRHQKRKIF